MPFHSMLANARPRGFSQTSAGLALGVSRATISSWERGQYAPSVVQVVRLWDIYGTTGEARAEMLTVAAAEWAK